MKKISRLCFIPMIAAYCLAHRARFLAFVLSSFLTGTVALAQQQSDWRPSVADDNKAASLPDTTEFIVNTMSHVSGAFISAPKANFWESVEPVRVQSTQQCTLHYDYRFAGVNYMGGGFKPFRIPVVDDVVDMKAIDPLSISVVYHQADPKDALAGGYYNVTFRGHNNAAIGVQTSATYSMAESALQPEGRGKTDFPCVVGIKCTPGQSLSLLEGDIAFRDSESARRLARALLHAALLCGGTKAVSPF